MYFLQLVSDEQVFEKVPEDVFKNRKFAVDAEGNKRYTDNWFSSDGATISLHLDSIPVDFLGGLTRLFSVTNQRVGRFDEPTHVEFVRGRSRWLHELETGKRWRAA